MSRKQKLNSCNMTKFGESADTSPKKALNKQLWEKQSTEVSEPFSRKLAVVGSRSMVIDVTIQHSLSE